MRPGPEAAARSSRCFVLPDPAGVLRAKYQPASPAGGAPPRFSEYVFAVDEQDRLVAPPADPHVPWPSWATGFRDLDTGVDGEVPRPLAWRHEQEAVFVSVGPGSPWAAAAPRQAVARGVEGLRSAGLAARIGVELEFLLLDAAAPAAPAGQGRAYGMDASAAERSFFDRLVPALTASGIGIDSWTREGGAGQWELALSHADPRDAADGAALARLAVLELAPESGLCADFAPVHEGTFGSGLHAHVSFSGQADRNPLLLAEDGALPDGPGAAALAGILSVLGEGTALLAPSAGSYARFAPHSAAGTSATWAPESRSVGVRHLQRGESTRLELRVAASDADPYLVVALLLAGAASGAAQSLHPPPAVAGDAYAAVPAGAALPTSLGEAAERLAASRALRSALGDGFVDHQVTLARWRAAHG